MYILTYTHKHTHTRIIVYFIHRFIDLTFDHNYDFNISVAYAAVFEQSVIHAFSREIPSGLTALLFASIVAPLSCYDLNQHLDIQLLLLMGRSVLVVVIIFACAIVIGDFDYF